MKPENERAMRVAGAAVVLGIAGDGLLRVTPWGINLLLWLLAGMALTAFLHRWREDGPVFAALGATATRCNPPRIPAAPRSADGTNSPLPRGDRTAVAPPAEGSLLGGTDAARLFEPGSIRVGSPGRPVTRRVAEGMPEGGGVRSHVWSIVPLLVGAIGIVLRDSPVVTNLCLAMLVLSLGVALWRMAGGMIFATGMLAFAERIILQLMQSLFATVELIETRFWEPFCGREAASGKGFRVGLRVLAGLLISVPVLLVFGSLFALADPVFNRLAADWVDVDFEALFWHAVFTLGIAWVAGGFLHQYLQAKQRPVVLEEVVNVFRFPGGVELLVVLLLLNLLFAAFLLVQIPYLFWGSAWVLETEGLTYADYARRGFFELVSVAVLLLPLLLGVDWLLRGDSDRRRFRWLAGGLVIMTFAVMASAVQRMKLYQEVYGLTELRFYTMAFMGWLGFVFLWFAFTVLRNLRERFLGGGMMAGFAMVALLVIANPDAWIARTNVERLSEGQAFDVEYARELSADAAPVFWAALPILPPGDRETMEQYLLQQARRIEPDWRAWNRSRSRAAALALQGAFERDREIVASAGGAR